MKFFDNFFQKYWKFDFVAISEEWGWSTKKNHVHFKKSTKESAKNQLKNKKKINDQKNLVRLLFSSALPLVHEE